MVVKYRPSMFGNHIVTEARASRMKDNITNNVPVVLDGTQRTSSGRFGFGWNEVLSRTQSEYTPYGLERYTVELSDNESAGYDNNRLFIRSNYGGSAENQAERAVLSSHRASDFYNVQAFALKYHVEGDEWAAHQAVNILNKWLDIEFWHMPVSDTRLSMSDKWTGYILSAMMLKGSEAYTSTVEARMRATTAKWWPQISTAYASGQSNWAGWGCAFEMYCSVFLGERERFNDAVLLWRKIFDRSVLNNEPWTETGRAGGENLGETGGVSGIQYSNFFTNSMVRCAEIARVNGVWLYDHTAPDGSTLRGVYENCISWLRDWTLGPYGGPSTPSRNIQSYILILHNLWPNEDSENIVEQKPSASGDAVGPSNTFQDSTGHSFTPLLYFGNPLVD